MVEGTRLGRPGKAPTEGEVREALHGLLKEHPEAPAVVDFAPRNLERLLSCLEVGRDLGRALVVTPKDAYLLLALAEAEREPWTGVLREVLVLREPKGRRDGWEEALWAQGGIRPVTLEEVAQDPAAYLLALGFYEINRLLDLRLLERASGRPSRRGVYVFSNAFWADQEQILDLRVLLEWLKRLEFDLYPKSLRPLPDDPSRVENPYHTSGHAPEGDLVAWVRRLKPRYLLPVHTEAPHRWQELLAGEGVEVLL
jgi:ribonuclease J